MGSAACRRLAHRREHLLVARPRPAHHLGYQPSLALHDRFADDDDFELPPPALLELDGRSQLLPDQSGATRRLGRAGASGLAVDDPNVHQRCSSMLGVDLIRARLPRGQSSSGLSTDTLNDTASCNPLPISRSRWRSAEPTPQPLRSGKTATASSGMVECTKPKPRSLALKNRIHIAPTASSLVESTAIKPRSPGLPHASTYFAISGCATTSRSKGRSPSVT